MKAKKFISMLLCFVMLMGALAACGERADGPYETGDASLDNPRNQDDIGETELLVEHARAAIG